MDRKWGEPTKAQFIREMVKLWESEPINSHVNDGLKALWGQMVKTYNDQLNKKTKRNPIWKVLQPPTGTGKTKGLELYCSLLYRNCKTDDNFPGVLIVTRQKSEADKIAASINDLTGKRISEAHHGDHKIDEPYDVPVLVVTHRELEIQFKEHLQFSTARVKSAPIFQWFSTEDLQRKLVVIDENMNFFDSGSVSLEDLRVLIACTPEKLRKEFSKEFNGLLKLESFIDGLGEKGVKPEIIFKPNILYNCDYTDFRKAMSKYGRGYISFKSNKDNKNNAFEIDVIELIKNVQKAYGSFSWITKGQYGHKIMMSNRLLVPDSINGVILDATASENSLFSLCDDYFKVIDLPKKKARSYGNVTLHVKRARSVGKGTSVERAKEQASKLNTYFKQKLGSKHKVFAVTHEDAEKSFSGYVNFNTAHWGALTGLNDWSELDTALIFSIPFRDQKDIANQLAAIKDLRPNQWYIDQEMKIHVRDLNQYMIQSQIIADIVQAINRIRCRKVSDEWGKCQSSDIYIFLPKYKQGNVILEGIKKHMPNIKVKEWDDYTPAKGSLTKSEQQLVDFIINDMESGNKLTGAEVQDKAAFAPATWYRLSAQLKDHSTSLYKAVKQASGDFEVVAGNRTYLLKK